MMPSVETIYRETVRPLPVEDQKRLADMILDNVDKGTHPPAQKRSVLEVLRSIHAQPAFKTAAEVDEHIRMERDAWDD
ncbi:MAG: hypothetical protein AB7F88_01325 [Pyrinomonadaceae bacterium]